MTCCFGTRRSRVECRIIPRRWRRFLQQWPGAYRCLLRCPPCIPRGAVGGPSRAGARCAVSRETATMVAGGGAQWESASPGAPPVRPCGVGGAATARPRGTSVETSWSRLEHAIATRINDRTSRQGIQLPCTKNRIRAPLRWKWRPRGPPGLSDVAYRSYVPRVPIASELSGPRTPTGTAPCARGASSQIS